MKDTELFNWLVQEALKEDISRLIQLTVSMEITNLEVNYTSGNPDEEFDWPELILAGSLLAKSERREHQEAALRIATAAVTLETAQGIRDAGAVLLEKLSNHRSVELAEKRSLVLPDLESRLGVTMRLEANKRRFEDAVLLESSGEWISVNDFQRELWKSASSAFGSSWLSASAPTASGKTFLVLQWLVDHLRTRDTKIAIYLPPHTRSSE